MTLDSAWDIFVLAMVEHSLLSCMVIYGLVFAWRSWRTLAAMPQAERTKLRWPTTKRTVKRFVTICLAWWCGVSIVGYGIGVVERRDANKCERFTSQEYKDYYVEKCSLTGWNFHGRILIRLYATGTNELLAEEMGNDSEYGLNWKNTRSRSYVENDGIHLINEPSAPYIEQMSDPIIEIELPPSWWSRMRAKLP